MLQSVRVWLARLPSILGAPHPPDHLCMLNADTPYTNSAGTLIAEMALHDCNSHCHYTTCTDCYRVDSKIFAYIMVNNMIDINKTGKMKLKCDCDELSLMNC